MYVVVMQDGTRWLRQATLLCMDTLRRMFEWIDSADTRVRERLYPDTFDDPEDEAAWRKLMQADLEHLVASRRALVAKDLARAKRDGPDLYRFPVSRQHRDAWLSSLNAARLALFALHGLRPADMDGEPEALGDEERQLALVRIHIMGFVQELVVAEPGEPDDDAPADAEAPNA